MVGFLLNGGRAMALLLQLCASEERLMITVYYFFMI